MLIHRHEHHQGAAPDAPVGTENNNNNTNLSKPHSKWQKRIEGVVRKIAIPLNSLATGRGCESFVPISMEEECTKAARILRSFSYPYTRSANALAPTSSSHIVTIPPSSISSAVGVLIFTTGRVGLSRLSGSTGSGILITRQDDTDEEGASSSNSGWNYPLAIQTHGVGLGPLALGFDVSDRVYLIRSRESLDKMLNKGQFMVGPEVVLAFGKWGGGAGLTFTGSFKDVKDGATKARDEIVTRTRGRGWGGRPEFAECQRCQHHAQTNENMAEETTKSPVLQPENEKAWEAVGAADEKSALLVDTGHPNEPLEAAGHEQTPPPPPPGRTSHPPIHCYMRSHGLYAGLQAEGTVFSERADTTAEFYSRAGAFDHEQAWREGPEGRAVEGVWEALRELEFGPRGLGGSSVISGS